jgi:hypothetical protein
MRIFRIAQVMNVITNPEGVKRAFRELEHQEMDESEGWKDWLNFLNLKDQGISEDIIAEMSEGVVASIYVQGGWHRYLILGNGDVMFSEMHAMDDGIQNAQKAGFQVG